MLEMFQKLINEHGSSVILKERIELINDKYEALQGKLELAQRENEVLKKENELLKQQLAALESSMPKLDSMELPEIQKNILKLLFSQPDGILDRQLARQLNLDEGTLTYHLEELEQMELTDYPSYTMGSNLTGSQSTTTYHISKSGRKYVVEVLNA